MKAEIVSVGTELLLGAITDTNATFLTQRLAALGIDCYYVSQVGDNRVRLADVLRRAWERSDLTVTTGGLGPTDDDLTREAIADVLGEQPALSDELAVELRSFFARRGVAMPDSNLKQATLIPSAQALTNPVGTAPGWWVQRDAPLGRRIIVAMPGVPFEMMRMWQHEVEPRLRGYSRGVIWSRTLKVAGMGESAVAAMVGDLFDGSNPTLAPYAKADGIHLRITAKAPSQEEAARLVAPLEGAVRARLGDNIYGVDDESLPDGVCRLLRSQGMSWTVLEVGELAAGSLASLAREGSQGTVTAPDLSTASRILGAGGADGTLEQLALRLISITQADVAVGIQSHRAALEGAAGSVEATAQVVLAWKEPGRAHMGDRAEHRWRTSPSEVGRLAGLAALNLLRRRLLGADL